MHRLTAPMLAILATTATAAPPQIMWVDAGKQSPDTYVAFRGRLNADRDMEAELRTVGSSWFVVWLDGAYLTEGPARFVPGRAEYSVLPLKLTRGPHVLAVQVHHIGETTRMLMDMPPFLYCEAITGGNAIPIAWKCTRLPGYKAGVRRINPQLGWIEWCDTRQNPAGWTGATFDDAKWTEPVAAATNTGTLAAANLAPVGTYIHPLEPVAKGSLAENFGYEFDDVPARFFLRDLACDGNPAQGTWRRYDLGFVRLGRPRLTLDLPAGAIVELGYSETLQHGRVSPYITLSAGASCNLDHYVARGGTQEFFPLTPKGGRCVEVHVLAPPDKIRFVKEEYLERSYHGGLQGSLSTSDELLDHIWLTGVETFRACSEDALIDNPTRERGQWTGDVVSVGMDINAVAYSDLRLCRRGLVQSSLCAREDGLIAGLCPGGPAFLSSYAAQWVDACVHYYELTGDKKLLEELYPAAVRNVGAFEKQLGPGGVSDALGWAFIDWGYVRTEGPADIALNLHVLSAMRAMSRWCRVIGREADSKHYDELAGRIEGVARAWLAPRVAEGVPGWEKVGFQTAVLALRMGLIEAAQVKGGLAYIRRHILSCFPNDRSAPRLSDPAAANRRLITPYFAHYAFPVLIENGEMDFVLDQYRNCWGWSLEQATTWVEVFDTRWTHCHQWAGCPTWQLSRYVLGLHPQFNLGRNSFMLKLRPGSLNSAKGTIPLAGGNTAVAVSWERNPNGIRYRLDCPEKVTILRPAPTTIGSEQPVVPATFTGKFETVIPLDQTR